MTRTPGSAPGAAGNGGPYRHSYVELHCHSAFSFLDGTSLADELVAAALARGHEALTADADWRDLEPTGLAALDDPSTPAPGGAVAAA